jgi:hypothetical protein
MSKRPTPETSEAWKGPFSWDIGSDGAACDVAMLFNPKHSQGKWVKIEDFRDLQRQRDELIAAIERLAADFESEGDEFRADSWRVLIASVKGETK